MNAVFTMRRMTELTTRGSSIIIKGINTLGQEMTTRVNQRLFGERGLQLFTAVRSPRNEEYTEIIKIDTDSTIGDAWGVFSDFAVRQGVKITPDHPHLAPPSDSQE